MVRNESLVVRDFIYLRDSHFQRIVYKFVLYIGDPTEKWSLVISMLIVSAKSKGSLKI